MGSGNIYIVAHQDGCVCHCNRHRKRDGQYAGSGMGIEFNKGIGSQFDTALSRGSCRNGGIMQYHLGVSDNDPHCQRHKKVGQTGIVCLLLNDGRRIRMHEPPSRIGTSQVSLGASHLDADRVKIEPVFELLPKFTQQFLKRGDQGLGLTAFDRQIDGF